MINRSVVKVGIEIVIGFTAQIHRKLMRSIGTVAEIAVTLPETISQTSITIALLDTHTQGPQSPHNDTFRPTKCCTMHEWLQLWAAVQHPRWALDVGSGPFVSPQRRVVKNLWIRWGNPPEKWLC
jgi:hypothetical protein